jgi:hypothetical protein
MAWAVWSARPDSNRIISTNSGSVGPIGSPSMIEMTGADMP